VLLGSPVARGFIVTLLEDNGGRERPLLPSLTELVVVGFSSYQLSSLPLCDALMKRVEQGIPLEILDLRTISASHLAGDTEDWLRSLSEIVVVVLDPEKTSEAMEQIESVWKTVARGRGLFLDIDDSREEGRPDTDSDEIGG
jgi:hypothetical protein